MLQEKSMPKIYGELALLLAVCINSFGVVLMLYSGAGISAISSVPFAFSEVLPHLSLGTWTYLFQGLLILSLMILRKRFVPQYLCSFLVGFVFSELLDVHEAWIEILPTTLPWKFLYFAMSYLLICIGIALSNRCGLPIIPTDLFPRELSQITAVGYPKIKIGFDVTCLAVTAGLTLLFLHRLDGLGIGTILAAFTMGKGVGIIGNWMDRRFQLKIEPRHTMKHGVPRFFVLEGVSLLFFHCLRMAVCCVRAATTSSPTGMFSFFLVTSQLPDNSYYYDQQ